MERIDKRVRLELSIGGMTCASCVARIEKKLRAVPGVAQTNVNLATEKATVVYDPALTTPTALADAVERAGYSASLPEAPHVQAGASSSTLLLGLILTVPVAILAFWPSAAPWPTPALHNPLLAILTFPVWGYVGWTFCGSSVRISFGLSFII